jgi:hypothetical protein
MTMLFRRRAAPSSCGGLVALHRIGGVTLSTMNIITLS